MICRIRLYQVITNRDIVKSKLHLISVPESRSQLAQAQCLNMDFFGLFFKILKAQDAFMMYFSGCIKSFKFVKNFKTKMDVNQKVDLQQRI